MIVPCSPCLAVCPPQAEDDWEGFGKITSQIGKAYEVGGTGLRCLHAHRSPSQNLPQQHPQLYVLAVGIPDRLFRHCTLISPTYPPAPAILYLKLTRSSGMTCCAPTLSASSAPLRPSPAMPCCLRSTRWGHQQALLLWQVQCSYSGVQGRTAVFGSTYISLVAPAEKLYLTSKKDRFPAILC